MNKNKKYLVTGGAGFIGSSIVDVLIAAGHNVVVIDNLSTGKRANINKKAKFYKADIRNLQKILPYFKGVDFVFHCAANPRIQPSIKNPSLAIENNIVGTFNVLTAAKKYKIKRLVYSGSSTFYGNAEDMPMSEWMPPQLKTPYALSKYVGEQLCRQFSEFYGLQTVCLRYFNVYGPRQLATGSYATVIGIFLKQFKTGKPMTIVGDGLRERDFTHIKDVVAANMLAMESPLVGGGETVNIGTGKTYTIRRVAELIGGMKFSKLLKLKKAKFITDRPAESQKTQADNYKAKTFLGWVSTVNLEWGIICLL